MRLVGTAEVPVPYPHVRAGGQQERVVRGAHELTIHTVVGRLQQTI